MRKGRERERRKDEEKRKGGKRKRASKPHVAMPTSMVIEPPPHIGSITTSPGLIEANLKRKMTKNGTYNAKKSNSTSIEATLTFHMRLSSAELLAQSGRCSSCVYSPD